ncbi:histidine kinase dimerization/phospho-acceptor domain-containing protein [Streptomyces amakusaensis]
MGRSGSAGTAGARILRAVRALLNWRSLRWKITALVVAASCSVALVVGGLVHLTTVQRLQSEARSIALTELATVVREHRAAGLADVPSLDELPEELRRRVALSDTPVTWYDTRRPGEPWMWAAERLGDGAVAVRFERGAEERSLAALDRSLVQAVVAALLVVVPLSVLITEVLNRRLRRVTVTARAIAGGDLDARTGARDRGGDEIADISRAVDSMAAALQERLLTEQRFTADVAHELRTPLMGLVTSTGLLADGEATELVRDRVRVLRGLVEDLLEISRLDAGAEAADPRRVPVGSVVEASVARTGLRASTTVMENAETQTDPRRLDRIISNLVVNAHRHGRGPVEVRVDGLTVVVRDHGPGFPAALLESGPQRFRTGSAERGHGHGLGLTIALGQARVIGAVLRLSNAPDGGAVAVLRLPADTEPIHD